MPRNKLEKEMNMCYCYLLNFTDLRKEWFKSTELNFGHVKCELFLQVSNRGDKYKTRYIFVDLGIEVKSGIVDLENGNIKSYRNCGNR